MERWRGEGVVGSDGGGKGGVVESDGGEREEREGWGLMEGGGSAAGLSSSMCVLVVLSWGVCYAWVVCHHCLREACHRPWVGVVGCGHWVVVLFVGSGRRLWVWGGGRGCWVVVHGRWVVVRGHSVVVGGMGLSIGGGGAPSRGRVARGCWFVVRGGAAVTQHGEQRRTTMMSSFIVWLPHRSQQRGTCTPPSFPLRCDMALVVCCGGCGRRQR